MSHTFIWPIDRTLSGATTSSQNEPGDNGNKEVLSIPQSPKISWALSSDCFVSYLGHSLGDSQPSTEMQSMYSSAPVDWATLVEEVLPLCRDAVGVFYSPILLGQYL